MGKTLDWESSKYDWRDSGDCRKIAPHHWEADFASAPLKAFYDIGGYDEDLDRGWSSDNVSVAERAEKAGYKFMVFPELKVLAYDHDKKMRHPFRHLYQQNVDTLAIKRKMIEKGEKLDFLKREE